MEDTNTNTNTNINDITVIEELEPICAPSVGNSVFEGAYNPGPPNGYHH